MKKFRTVAEQQVGRRMEEIFNASHDSVEARLENFPKYVRRQHLKRFLALYEIFKLAMPVKGSVVECGVFRGFGVMSWAKLSAMLEPENLTRRIYGFDSFEGFPSTSGADDNPIAQPEAITASISCGLAASPTIAWQGPPRWSFELRPRRRGKKRVQPTAGDGVPRLGPFD